MSSETQHTGISYENWQELFANSTTTEMLKFVPKRDRNGKLQYIDITVRISATETDLIKIPKEQEDIIRVRNI